MFVQHIKIEKQQVEQQHCHHGTWETDYPNIIFRIQISIESFVAFTYAAFRCSLDSGSKSQL